MSQPDPLPRHWSRHWPLYVLMVVGSICVVLIEWAMGWVPWA